MLNNQLIREVEFAKEALKNEPNGRLTLEYRKKIWSVYGPRKMDKAKAIIEKPLIKRVKLAALCAEKVLPIWLEAYSDKYDAVKVLNFTSEYLDGLSSWERGYDIYNEFRARMVELEEGPLRPLAAGKYISRVLATALYDLDCDGDESDEEYDCEEDDDIDLWDASFAASVALSGIYWSESDNDIERRREYWNWYLNEAVFIADT